MGKAPKNFIFRSLLFMVYKIFDKMEESFFNQKNETFIIVS